MKAKRRRVMSRQQSLLFKTVKRRGSSKGCGVVGTIRGKRGAPCPLAAERLSYWNEGRRGMVVCRCVVVIVDGDGAW